MKIKDLLLMSTLSISTALLGDDRVTLFEGLGAKAEMITDSMTDKKTGVIFLYFGPIYLAINSHNDFTIWPSSDGLHFAFDSIHQIKIPGKKPFNLKTLVKRNCLKPTSPSEAEAIIRSLLKGEEVKIRYIDWPSHDTNDYKLINSNFGYIYNIIFSKFKWKNIGVSGELAKPTLRVYQPAEESSKGYASISVNENNDLQLQKGFDKYGGGANIQVGVKGVFGFNDGSWVCGSVSILGNEKITIRDSSGVITFQEKIPDTFRKGGHGGDWPLGEKAALAAWRVGPMGSIEIDGIYGKRILLYGFKELWHWGVQNAGFPVLEVETK